MALAKRAPLPQAKGKTKPRLAPPVPVRSLVKDFQAIATELGYELMPWQEYAARYLTGLGTDERWLYREIAIVVARRNGKTTLLLPRILMALRAGEAVLHTAQDRSLPRELFEELADKLAGSGEVKFIRWANGQETIRFKNGGKYTLVAPNHGIRGRDADLIIVDEVREQHDDRVARAILPTVATSTNAQIIYLSNAGDEASVLLNDLRARRDDPGRLAYLEWSAGPERKVDDLTGWAEANPALGYTLTTETLRELRESLTEPAFETEHLCRWVVSMRERLVHEATWAAREGEIGKPVRPYMAVSMDPEGRRASAAIAWAVGDKAIHATLLFDVTGSPIDTTKLGKDMYEQAMRLGVIKTGFDPMTDAELAKFFKKSEAITGRVFSNATARFVTAVEGAELTWANAGAVTDDLAWTARKEHADKGTFEAVRADDEHPNTAVLAMIRAVWLASGPRLQGARIY